MKLNHTTLYVLAFALIMVFFLATIYGFGTSAHEETHAQIMEYFGCSDPITKYSLLGTSFAACASPHNTTVEEKMLHSQNEILGYNLEVLYAVIMLSALLVCITLLYVGKEEPKDVDMSEVKK
jgi:hypothetical protein